MEKFRRFCDDAWQRLRLHHSRPLSWAGRAGAGFNPAGRVVISRLVDAIARHRALVQDQPDVRGADLELWKVLRDVGLDPVSAYDTRIIPGGSPRHDPVRGGEHGLPGAPGPDRTGRKPSGMMPPIRPAGGRRRPWSRG